MIRPPGRPRRSTQPLDVRLLWRRCEQCRMPYEKPANEPWTRWLRRRFCSHDCYHRARRSA